MDNYNDIDTILNQTVFNVSNQLEDNHDELNDKQSSYIDDLNSERQNIINTYCRGV